MAKNEHPEQDPAEGSRKVVERELAQSERSTNHGAGGEPTERERAENRRETGAREFRPQDGPEPMDEFSQDAAKNRKPPLGQGLTERVNETNDKTRHSDGQR